MKIVKQEVKLLTDVESLKKSIISCERAARTCYNSIDKQTGKFEDAVEFLSNLLGRGHQSVIEHASLTAEFTTNIGVSREFERHRNTSFGFEGELQTAFSERSTRYCNYGKDERYPEGIEFCLSEAFKNSMSEKNCLDLVQERLKAAEDSYLGMTKAGCKAQEARMMLPLATKTVFIVTANLREWKWIYSQRSSSAAHPDIRELMELFRKTLKDVGLDKLIF